MLNYDPGVFSNLYSTQLGQDLWEFLNENDNVIRMETATALSRPAVEALEHQLLERFDTAVLEDRVKQMIGHMVRQIMERRGYTIAAQNVKITGGAPFSRATRYKRPNDFTFHVFKNSKAPRMYALTGDKAGARLPNDIPSPGAKWCYYKSFQGELRGRIAFGLEDEKVARKEIERQGYYIYEVTRIMKAGRLTPPT